MVEIKKTRSHRIEGENIVAVLRKEYTNGQGNLMVQTDEEHGIPIETINKVLEEEVPAQLKKADEEREKTTKEMAEISEEIKKVVNTREYIQFKRQIEKEDFKKFMDVFSRERALKQAETRLDLIKKEREDICNWEVQFKAIKEAYEQQLTK